MINENRVFMNGMSRVEKSKKQVNKVYSTEDLSIFKFSKFNRNVFTRKEMLKQAEDGFIAPVIVNENMVVIDGQNRIHHSQIVGAPVTYVIIPGLDEDDIVRMNTVQKPWTLKNYIESYSNQGLNEYISLMELINENYANHTDVVLIAMNRLGSMSSNWEKVKSGDFKFHDMGRAVSFLKYYKRFKEETKTPSRSKVVLALYALYRLKDFDGDRLIKKVIQKNFDEEIRYKGFQFTDALKSMIDVYNDGYNESSKNFINYSITNNGNLKVEKELSEWAKEKTTHGELS